MECKRCRRCGCFFVSDNDVCSNCEAKDIGDIANIKSFMLENENMSIKEVAGRFGTSESNILRYMEDDNFLGGKHARRI